MADGAPAGDPAQRAEDDALQDALAAEHAAVWGYAVIGAATPPDGDRATVLAGEAAHRDVRDRLTRLVDEHGLRPVGPRAAYALPFPVLSAVDAAALGVTLEEGVAAAWVTVLDRAAQRSTRELAVPVLIDTELRAVGWRLAAGRTPATDPFPGL